MYVSLSLFLVVVAAVILWLRNPIQRASKITGHGWIREVNLLGFFFTVENMSSTLNKLEHEEKDLKDKLKKYKKNIEDEKKALDSRVKYVDQSYQAHLREWVDKRHWKYWFSRVAYPSLQFMPELKRDKKPEEKVTRTVYSLDEIPASVRAKIDPKTKSMVFVPKPEQQQQQKRKGSNNQNQQQNNGNQNNG